MMQGLVMRRCCAALPLLLVVLVLLGAATDVASADKPPVALLNRHASSTPVGKPQTMKLEEKWVLCYEGIPSVLYDPQEYVYSPRLVRQLWSEVRLNLRSPTRKFAVVDGNKSHPEASAAEALAARTFGRSDLRHSRLSRPARVLNTTCLGVVEDAASTGDIRYHVSVDFNVPRFALWCAGIGLVIVAPLLSQSVVFYYASFGTLGTVVIVLVVAYFAYSFVRRRIPLPTVVLDAALSLGLFGGACLTAMNEALDEFLALPVQEMAALVYAHPYFLPFASLVTVVFFISFSYLYVRGPPSERMSDVLSVLLSAIGTGVSVYAIQDRPLGLLLAISALVMSRPQLLAPLGWLANVAMLPFVLLGKLITAPFYAVYYLLWAITWPVHVLYGYLRGPPGRRLLSEAEYRRESERYTQQQVAQLRQQMQDSPNQVRLIRRLSPRAQVKALAFLDGEDHVGRDERHFHDEVSEDDYEYDDEEEDIGSGGSDYGRDDHRNGGRHGDARSSHSSHSGFRMAQPVASRGWGGWGAAARSSPSGSRHSGDGSAGRHRLVSLEDEDDMAFSDRRSHHSSSRSFESRSPSPARRRRGRSTTPRQVNASAFRGPPPSLSNGSHAQHSGLTRRSIPSLSIPQLRQELQARGFAVGPILPQTRKLFEAKLERML